MNSYDLGESALTDSIDTTILMHRDSHFSGSFELMAEYYSREGIGCHPEITLEQIQRLANMARLSGQNIAPLLLTGADAEKIGRSKKMYKALRDLYGNDREPTIPLLIADLILSEEEFPENEIAALVHHGPSVVSSLIEVIRSDDLHDPLFPGYGLAPERAAECLGKIGDDRAISSLFELVHEDEFFEEDAALNALKHIGEPAKRFLLKVVQNQPFTSNNERAAIALSLFDPDPAIATTCLKILREPGTYKNLPFATYLVLCCLGLEDPSDRAQFAEIGRDPKTPTILHQDFKSILKLWNS